LAHLTKAPQELSCSSLLPV